MKRYYLTKLTAKVVNPVATFCGKKHVTNELKKAPHVMKNIYLNSPKRYLKRFKFIKKNYLTKT